MTLREETIRDLTEEINRKKRYVNEIQEEISALERKLDKYNTVPDAYYATPLSQFEDFPFDWIWCHYDLAKVIGSIGDDGELNDPTINDLIHSSPEELLKVRYCGKVRLKKIEDWMAKHNLRFIS